MTNISQLLTADPVHKEILKSAGRIAERKGLSVYVVGGFVRDTLMNRPTTDIDLMVEGDGIAFAAELSTELQLGNVVVYERFGTALIPGGPVEIEVATARKELYQPDSRKPEISAGTIKEDMSRRDFTVNTLAVSLRAEDFGDLFDPFGGLRDMAGKRLVTPLDPDATFSDDPLRMLRATRFAAQLGFSIDPVVLDSIQRQAHRLQIVSKERITEEIIKTLRTEKPSIGFDLMKQTGLLPFTFPELDMLSGVERIGNKGHKDVFLHTLKVVDNAAVLTPKMEIRFAALVHDIAKPQTKRFEKGKGWTFHGHDEIGRRMIKKIAWRMKISNELRDYLMLLTKLHLRPIALAKSGVSDSAIRRVMLEAGEHIEDLMILCRADITTKNPNKVKKYMSNFEHVETLMQDVALRDEMRAFQSPVRGDVIMRELKLRPGPRVGIIKQAIEEAILDGLIPNDYDAAFEYMLSVKDDLLGSDSTEI
ncbi:MAG: HD domain-containing protein [FCB group bacterium]|nr:HD domain-containing protein [FCB group bacterium]